MLGLRLFVVAAGGGASGERPDHAGAQVADTIPRRAGGCLAHGAAPPLTRAASIAAPLLLALALSLAGPCLAAERLSVRVVAVVDGDTIRAMIGEHVERVRILGLDAPELGEHARCRIEADLAERARLHLAGLLRQGPVTVEPGRRDRYGRLLGVVRVSGRDVAPMMVNASLARPYEGGRRLSWCPGI